MRSARCCLTTGFNNVICLGLILDEEGHKMSKSRGNVADPWEVFDEHGADAMRWYLYTASPPGKDRRFSKRLVGEVIRNFTLTLWNTYSSLLPMPTWITGAGVRPGTRIQRAGSLAALDAACPGARCDRSTGNL